jgi:hypothetical protein
MSEELNKELPEGGAPDNQEVNTPEPTAIELRAMEMGWRPKEEFQGDEADFIDAGEFVRRKPLFEKIDGQSRELKAVRRALEEFKTHYNKVNENAYERALASLKAERRQALTEGDGDRFEQIDDQIKAVEKQVEQVRADNAKPVVQDDVVHPEFQSWKSRNSWYDETSYMRKYADEVGIQLHQRGLAPAEVLKEVEKAVRKEFPQKFVNPNKAAAPDVEAGSTGTRKSGGGKDVELTEVERKVMNDLVRSGVMTKAEYIADIKKLKGL